MPEGFSAILPLLIFAGIVAAVWAFLSMISQRNTSAEERLKKFTLTHSGEQESQLLKGGSERMEGLMDQLGTLGQAITPKKEGDVAKLKLRLSYAGFRSEKALPTYLGLKFLSLMVGLILGVSIYLPQSNVTFGQWEGMTAKIIWIVFYAAAGMFLPEVVLWYLVRKRQEAIFLSLPDALDLMVVCVESGLGLDQAMRKVATEMKEHAPVIADELERVNFDLQLGKPKREALHDLGVRTGVDDVRSLVAILIQADRFGSSIAQALRVQSDSMRIRRRQLAEEKAAKCAVQLIFPLVFFIFPGVFVVLVGPASIRIREQLFKEK